MKQFVAIIGGRNSGKSTIISSLTGCCLRTFRGTIEDRAARQKIRVIASSPQEDPLSHKKFTNILNSIIRDNAVIGIVMAIQPTYPRKRLSLEEIIKTAQETKQFNIHAVIIYPSYNSDNSGVDIDVQDVKARLQKLRVSSAKVLDGRRFAYLNAHDIRESTGLP